MKLIGGLFVAGVVVMGALLGLAGAQSWLNNLGLFGGGGGRGGGGMPVSTAAELPSSAPTKQEKDEEFLIVVDDEDYQVAGTKRSIEDVVKEADRVYQKTKKPVRIKRLGSARMASIMKLEEVLKARGIQYEFV